MNDDQLEGNLRSIGKGCFVTFFAEYCDFELLNETVARYIAEDWNCSLSAALTRRVYPARKIIQSGRARDALINCSKSRRLPPHIRNRAAALAADLPATPPATL